MSVSELFRNDPVLRLTIPPADEQPFPARIRFRPDSDFARDFGLTPGAEGTVTGRYCEDGKERLNVLLDREVAMGVPADEVESLPLHGP